MAKRLGKGFVEFFLKSDKFNAGAKKVMAVLGRMKDKMRAASNFARNFLIAGVAAAGGLVKLAMTQIEAERKLAAVMRATGNASGFTTKQLIKQAQALQKITTFGDEAIINAQAILATFKEIKGDVFKDAIGSILDMASVLDTDLKGAAVQIGKALNDPVKGISALSRVGVSFTQTQKNQIASFVAANDVMSAQRVILKELQGEFGGVAQAMGKTDVGKFRKALNQLGDAGEKFGIAILRALTDALPHLERFANWVNTLNRRDFDNFIRKAKILGAILIGVWAAPKLIGAIQGFVALVKWAGAATTAMVAGPLAALAAGYAFVAIQADKAAAAGKRIIANSRNFADTSKELLRLKSALGEAGSDQKRLTIMRQIEDAQSRIVDLTKESVDENEGLNDDLSTTNTVLSVISFGLAGTSKKAAASQQDQLNFAENTLKATRARVKEMEKGIKVQKKTPGAKTSVVGLPEAVKDGKLSIQMVGLEEQFLKIATGTVDRQTTLAKEANDIAAKQLVAQTRMAAALESVRGPLARRLIGVKP